MVVPKTIDDVVAAVRVCHEHGAPILNRGCATSLSGETTNVAVVIDHSKHLRGIEEVNAEEGYAWVQPGVIRDQLANRTEAEHDLTFAPDTSTHEYATFGGMIGNNSCGIHSIMAGRTSDNVYELDVVTYDGVRMTVGQTSEEELERIVEQGGRRGEIYAAMLDLRERYADLIRERYPDIPRRVSGYNLDELLPERGFNVARALVGSEGTLVTVLRAKVRLVHSPPKRALLVLGYPTIYDAGDHTMEILGYGPTGLEGIDGHLISDLRRGGNEMDGIEQLPDGEGWLLAEFGGETTNEADGRAHECMARLEKDDVCPSMKLIDDEQAAQTIWQVRENGLGATA